MLVSASMLDFTCVTGLDIKADKSALVVTFSNGAKAEVQADEANAAALINLLKQQGLRS